MPIAKGEEWGSAGSLPDASPLAHSDHQVAELVEAAMRSATLPITIGVDGGDLARTLGARPPYDRQSPKQLLPVDVLQVTLGDGTPIVGCAHVVIGARPMSAPRLAIMNAAFVGPLNISPRGHPGDGKADVVTFDLNTADRVKAYRRMPTASHLPHPGIRVQRQVDGTFEFARSQLVRVDGKRVGRTTSLAFRVLTGALIVAV